MLHVISLVTNKKTFIEYTHMEKRRMSNYVTTTTKQVNDSNITTTKKPTLNKLRIEGNHLNLIKVICDKKNPTANMLNSERLKSFPLFSG